MLGVMRFVTDHKLSDCISITELQKITGILSVPAIIKCKGLRLFRHMKRSSVALYQIYVEGMIQGSRSNGRQKKRRINICEWTQT